MTSYFKLYANCILVKGINNSVIYDLFLSRYYVLPIELANLINEFEESSFDCVISSHQDFQSEITSFCNELINQGYADWFEEDELELYPNVNLEWDYPAHITNVVINSNNHKVISKTLMLVEDLLTPAVLLRTNKVDTNLLVLLNKVLETSIVSHIEIITPILSVTHKEIERNMRLKTIWLGNKIPSEFKNYAKIKSIKERVYFKQKHPVYELFTESQAHHTYFNRKMYIGVKGEIKNAPECKEEFGNINDLESVEELKQIIATPEFQKYWFVHKELCDVCKDCEFRHMCVDNRLPYQRKDGSWYHQIECNYNPYICKWKEEEGYQTLEEIGVVCNAEGFSIDHEKIAAINKILWEEESENA